MFYAERFPDPTRALGPRQLPTDHVPAVPTREYQSDQSSRQLFGSAVPYKKRRPPSFQRNADVISNRQTLGLDKSLHIRTATNDHTWASRSQPVDGLTRGRGQGKNCGVCAA